MISALIALLSSSGIGSIIGLMGGLANRWMDIRNKTEDHKYRLELMDRERLYMKEEAELQLQITHVEADAVVEKAGYEAMANSYGFAATTREDGLVDKFSKIIRPFLTLAFFFFTLYIFMEVSLLVEQLSLEPTSEQVWNIYQYIIQWIFFQSGAAIGWWFAMRPGKMPNFGGK